MKVTDFLKDLSIDNPHSKEVIEDIASIDWDEEILNYKISKYFSPKERPEGTEIFSSREIPGLLFWMVMTNFVNYLYTTSSYWVTESLTFFGAFLLVIIVLANFMFNFCFPIIFLSILHYEISDYLRKRKLLKISLTPEDMCDFWVKFIRRTFSEINRKVNSHKEELQEQMENVFRLKEDFYSEGLEKDPVYEEILLKYEYLENSMEENSKIKKAMKELRSALFKKVDELKKIVEDKNRLEQKSDRVSEIKSRAENILGKSDLILESWEAEKDQIEEKVRDLTLSFQSQFNSAKDLLESTKEVEGLLE